jgi:hypothetical protein
MVFNDPTNEQGLAQEIDSICNSDPNSYPVKAKLRRVNSALDRFFLLATNAAGNWLIDDARRTDYPIATTNIEQGKSDYQFPSELMDIIKVEVKNSNGEYVPATYEKKYGSLWLEEPKENITAGLRIQFTRSYKYLTTADTSVNISIPQNFFAFIARHASLPFLVEKAKASANNIAELIRQDEEDVRKHYSRRGRDAKTRIAAGVTQFI